MPERRRSFTVRSLTLVFLLLSLSLTLSSCATSVGAVSGVECTPNGTSLVVDWDQVAEASGYLAYLDTSPSVSNRTYTASAQTSSLTNTFDDLTIGTTYYVVVYAYGMGGLVVGSPSDVVSVYLDGSTIGGGANKPPVIQSLTSKVIGTQVVLSVSATDPEGDSLSYTWSVDGTPLSSQSAQVTYQGVAGSGDHTATVTVSDGTNSVSQSVDFHID